MSSPSLRPVSTCAELRAWLNRSRNLRVRVSVRVRARVRARDRVGARVRDGVDEREVRDEQLMPAAVGARHRQDAAQHRPLRPEQGGLLGLVGGEGARLGFGLGSGSGLG